MLDYSPAINETLEYCGFVCGFKFFEITNQLEKILYECDILNGGNGFN